MAVIGDSTASTPPTPTRGSASRAPVGTAAEPHRRPRRKRGSLLPVLLVAPAVILLLLFTIAPAIYAVILSFLQVKVGGGLLGGGGTVEVFAGFANYVSTLVDPEFWASLGRMLIVAVIGVPLTIVLSTVFALCLDAKRTRLVGFTRLAIFLPYAVPGVVASLLWGFMYLPATSPIGGQVIDYFGSTGIFFSVANVAVWGVVGFNMVILYTAVRSLPKDLFEAAELDGASELQIALRVKLPLIAPAITMVALFSIIGALQLFNEPTTLKPLANAISSTWVPLMRVYTDAFVNNSIYEGAATSFILIIMTVAATVLVNVIGRRIARRETK
ncbi:carbohydrate ABC transporter permease [Leifsonia sp. NPDC102414]|jgi:multiple sugar transport system permease protein|uniref:carbohydrate ABC transporter permease n=1 Tax=unclassified Leifsonia TaxID=2663824 RepID=UPI0009E98C78|nr:sugar ABC transporter permease [Leifsonia sp. Root227]